MRSTYTPPQSISFEGIELILTFGSLKKESSFVFTKFDSETFTSFVQGMCEEFVVDVRRMTPGELNEKHIRTT